MKQRLDILLVEQGLAASREKAKAMIMSGVVFVNGQREDKAGSTFDEKAAATIEIHGSTLRYVSRGGLKLEKAVEQFGFSLKDKVCMDVGASTGGFTDCMLQNGAAKVFSVDVGRGQLDWKLRNDERVVCMEKTNMRYVKPEDIGGTRLGSLGIPEFGTDFAMQMLIDTKPKYFSDLVRIAGLSHGTDVWLGNAQVLIQNGTATISTAICTRDDIMIYLIGKGVESGLAFTIMESVRKGKGLRDEWIQTMKDHDVPDWYIWSCKLIKYMFPKAHAAAYVMMAYRIAWYKVFHPLAYYAAFFSIRATSFSYELMCMGKERLEYYMAEIRKKGDEASKKEQDTLKDMRIVQEMYARGFDFVPIDLYKAKAHRFQIIGDKLMPALDTIEGLGDKAAEAVVDAAAKGKFLSKDDFRDRTKVSKTVIDLMDDLDLFGDIPQSNQMSLFDFTG